MRMIVMGKTSPEADRHRQQWALLVFLLWRRSFLDSSVRRHG